MKTPIKSFSKKIGLKFFLKKQNDLVVRRSVGVVFHNAGAAAQNSLAQIVALIKHNAI